MALSTDVNLPKSHRPVFPARCVVCGQEQPGNTVRVSTHTLGWWSLALWVHGPRFFVDAPACEWCRRGLRRQLWVRWIISLGFALFGVAVAMWILRSPRGPLRRWLAVGIALACMSPWFLWEILFPPPLDITAYSDTVDYEFRDAQYAADFTELNKDARINE
jgi:hypothetical protein